MEKNLSKLSVSKIAGIVTGKNFDGIDPVILEAARLRGNQIHAEVETNSATTDEAKWILKNLGEFNGTRLALEVKCEHFIDGLHITGRYDAKIIPEMLIIDFKTEATKDLRYWTIQLNLYALLDGAERLQVYHVPKSGNYSIVEIPKLTNKQIEEIISAGFEERILPDDFWDFMEKSNAEEINLDLIVYEHNIGKIETNVDTILEMITEKIKSYVPENYSEQNLDIAKKDKAALNRSAKFLNEKRIELERRHMEPIVKITEKIKSAKKLIEDASDKIDSIVKTVETREKDAVKKELQEYFESLDGSKLIKFDQIFELSMLNKTAKRNETKKAIAEKLEKVKSDLSILDRLDCPEAKTYYLIYLDLDAAINEADKIKELQEKLKNADQEKPIVLNIEKAIDEIYLDVIEPEKNRETEEEIFTRKFEVKGTKEQLNSIADFMNQNGIQWDTI